MPRFKICFHLSPAALPGEQADQKQNRPDEPVGENLGGGNGLELLPVDRNQPPGSERRESRDERGSLVRFARTFWQDRHVE